jgi:hypothetical protein
MINKFSILFYHIHKFSFRFYLSFYNLNFIKELDMLFLLKILEIVL